MRARGAQLPLQVVVEGLHVVLGEVAARDAGLVGDQKGVVAEIVDALHRRDRARDEDEILRPVHIAAVDRQRSVAVEEDRRARHPLVLP